MFYCALPWTLPDHMPWQFLLSKFIGYNWHNIIIVGPIETRTDTRNHFHTIARLIFLLKELFPTQCQQHIDRGSMQVVEHQLIYSPKNKKTVVTYSRAQRVIVLHIMKYRKQQTPHSIGRLSSFIMSGMGSSLFSSHGFPISAGSQLTLFTRTGLAENFFPPSCKPVPGSLDPGNCLFSCQAQEQSNKCVWTILPVTRNMNLLAKARLSVPHGSYRDSLTGYFIYLRVYSIPLRQSFF